MLLFALVGCGAGSKPAPSRPEASKSGGQILADSEAALGRVTSLHVESTGLQSGQSLGVTGDIEVPGRVHVDLTQGRGSVQFILIGTTAYFSANAAFLAAQGMSGAVAARLANRWIQPSSASAFGVAGLLAASESATIGRCTLGPHFGTTTVKGTSTLNGVPVIVLVDHGDVPGSTPRLLYLAATGPPLPLRIVQTGPQKLGGTPDATCGETKDDVSGESTNEIDNFSRYNAARPITAPPGALRLGALPGGNSV